MLSFASICPHPPIIIPSIGGRELGKVKKTIEAMEKLGDDFTRAKIDTVIVISPHGPVQWDKMTINLSPTLRGDFLNFGDATSMSFENDTGVARKIYEESQRNEILIDGVEGVPLDHGTMVPLYYLAKDTPNLKIVSIAYSFLDYQTHFDFGKVIGEVARGSSGHFAIIASGDLSHRLTPDAPAGYSPQGKEFDNLLLDLLKKGDVEGILKLDPRLIEEAGECGLRSIIILLGALNGIKTTPEILSYAGPFGVGYLVANFKLL